METDGSNLVRCHISTTFVWLKTRRTIDLAQRRKSGHRCGLVWLGREGGGGWHGVFQAVRHERVQKNSRTQTLWVESEGTKRFLKRRFMLYTGDHCCVERQQILRVPSYGKYKTHNRVPLGVQGHKITQRNSKQKVVLCQDHGSNTRVHTEQRSMRHGRGRRNAGWILIFVPLQQRKKAKKAKSKNHIFPGESSND